MSQENIKVQKVKKERTKTQKMVLISSILMLIVLGLPIIYQLISVIYSYITG